MSPADAWSDFGQRVDLTARLREILINYPEGTSILKEMVQNAGASWGLRHGWPPDPHAIQPCHHDRLMVDLMRNT